MSRGLLFDIKRFAVHDGPGIRTTVFFKGCPLRCAWCHNPESYRKQVEKTVNTRKLDGRIYREEEKVGEWMTVEQVMERIRKDAVFMNESEGGVTFSGGEPLMQPGFLEELARACVGEGFHTCLDTSGYAGNDALQRVFPYIDLFLYDIKSLDNERHRRYTGKSQRLILENFWWLVKMRANIRLRVPLIPGVNDREEDLKALEALLTEAGSAVQGVDLLPYHNLAARKHKTFRGEYVAEDIRVPDEKTMENIRKRLENHTSVPVEVGG
ncbi:MAG: glycyl-radical enzyme activating protein [Bacteroidales bacterium]